jgi:hypothetical protein
MKRWGEKQMDSICLWLLPAGGVRALGARRKSALLAFLLAVAFGPLGLIYVSFWNGLALCAAIAIALSNAPGPGILLTIVLWALSLVLAPLLACE